MLCRTVWLTSRRRQGEHVAVEIRHGCKAIGDRMRHGDLPSRYILKLIRSTARSVDSERQVRVCEKAVCLEWALVESASPDTRSNARYNRT